MSGVYIRVVGGAVSGWMCRCLEGVAGCCVKIVWCLVRCFLVRIHILVYGLRTQTHIMIHQNSIAFLMYAVARVVVWSGLYAGFARLVLFVLML